MRFDITIADFINIFMVAAGVGVCWLSMLQINKAPIRNDVRQYFKAFLWLIISYISAHLTRQMLGGHPGTAIRIIVKAVTFMEFLLAGFMAFMLMVMILYTALPEQDKLKRSLRAILVLLVLHIGMNCASLFSDMYYYFDENNVYHRSKLYLLSNIASIQHTGRPVKAWICT